MIFEHHRKIYGYECDIYGHLNNAMYFHIYEEARAEALNKTGYSITKFSQLGISLFVYKVEMNFLKAINLEEKVKVASEITSVNRLKSTWSQSIYNNNNILCNTVYIEAVFGKKAKAARINKNIEHDLKQFVSQK